MNRAAGIEDLLRDAAPQVLAALVRRFGDFAASEDAVQDAFLEATTNWPARGTPSDPVAWLIHVASRRMVDRIRSDSARRAREDAVALQEPASASEAPPGHDDTLVLMLMCCHTSLTPASAIALTLRAVGGLTTAEIAAAFLVPEATMAQRISRAKQTIKSSAVPFEMPAGRDLGERMRSVLHVLYLIFNEGYVTSSGARLAREELSGEAIRLTRMVRRAVPNNGEVAGLLALMLLTEARRRARSDSSGGLIPLAEQDRTLWDRALIDEGVALLAGAMRAGAVGEYQLQAAIAAVHDQAPRHEDTDWREILGLYGLLERMTGNPMVTLNKAVAAAMVDGPAAGLALLQSLEKPLDGHHRLHAVRAHLLEMAGDCEGAAEQFRLAASRTTSLPEQNYLLTKAAHARQPRAPRRAC